MLSVLREKRRLVLALLFLTLGALVSIPVDRGELTDAAPPQSSRALATPELTMILVRDKLSITGTSHSAEHEAAVAQVVAEHFPNREVRQAFTAGVLLPADWRPISVRLLQLMATMESATATMRRDQVSLRGVTAEADEFRNRLALLREAMTAGSVLLEDVILVDHELTLDDLCRRAFADLGALPVAFAESSTELRESSYPNLDRLVGFAWDCRNETILIAGHTDASGNAAWNRQLSQARAQAVADYLIANGVAPDRLIVEGRGSSEPIADNDTRYGRSLNRRIEFGLRPPLL